jgi:hypothetical protein
MTLLGIIIVGFVITDQLLNRLSAFVRYWRKNGLEWDRILAIYRLKENLRNSEEGSSVMYNILIHFGVQMKLGKLLRRCSKDIRI